MSNNLEDMWDMENNGSPKGVVNKVKRSDPM